MYRGQRLHVLTREWAKHHDGKELAAQISDQMQNQNTNKTLYITAKNYLERYF